MIPTWDSEAKERADLMSVCTLPARYAKTAVVTPTSATTAESKGEESRSGLTRKSRNAPRWTESAP